MTPQAASFAAARRLRVIEDACQAHGTRVAGAWRDLRRLGCFSTKDGKLLWSGEGGFILTRDRGLAGRCRAFRTHWQTPRPVKHHRPARLQLPAREPLAAIARANLARFDQAARWRGIRPDCWPPHSQPPPGSPSDQGAGLEWLRAPARIYSFPAALVLRAPAALGVPNSVGTYHLTPCDQRPMFATSPCAVPRCGQFHRIPAGRCRDRAR